MGIQRLTIQDFLSGCKNNLVLDVRSPGEYNHAHMPGAISLPLFTDEERKVVGTLYKQKSRQEAIKAGLDFFGPKMRAMVETAEEKTGSSTGNTSAPVYIYCWRGGMRSGAVAWLLDLYGFRVYTLAGGYKSFRKYVLDSFEKPYPFRILGGYTGSGKTEVLYTLEKNGEQVIDLEKIACHKGSAFGAHNMPAQPSQEMFENQLALELKALDALQSKDSFLASTEEISIWLEDESQRIGNLNIPQGMWLAMRTAPLFFLEIPFEERLDYIVQDYGSCHPDKLIDAVNRISKRLGGVESKKTLEHLANNEIKEAFRILLHYYDKRYEKGLNNREQLSALLTRIQCTTVDPNNGLRLLKPQPA
jgi:tRNA 2-selenouridine synthase